MFPRLITRYGLATHLALLASLPFVLFPFLPAGRLAQVIFCLAGMATVWLLVEPSIRLGEHLSIARRRVLRDILHDVCFWFFLVVMLVAFARFLNSDVALQYVNGEWSVSEPAQSIFPASVGQAGLLPLAVVVGIAVLLQGIRHGIGLKGRISFGITASFLMGVGGLAMVGFAFAGIPSFMGAAGADFLEGPFWGPFFGPVFGVWLICSLAFGANAEARKWGGARVPFCVAVAGNASGLIFFSPPVVVSAFLGLAMVFSVFCYVFLARSSMGAVARNLVLSVLGFAVPFFLAALIPVEISFDSNTAEGSADGSALVVPAKEVYAVKSGEFLSVGEGVADIYKNRSAILKEVAKEIWKKHPWYGAGAGSFSLHAPFLLSKGDARAFQGKKRDWRVKVLSRQAQKRERKEAGETAEGDTFLWRELQPRAHVPRCAFNSFWTFLAERGMVGMALVVVALGLLAVSYFRRFVMAVLFLRGEDDADRIAFACPPIAWVAPFAVLFLLVLSLFAPVLDIVPAWISVIVPLAVAAASFPKKPDVKVVLR